MKAPQTLVIRCGIVTKAKTMASLIDRTDRSSKKAGQLTGIEIALHYEAIILPGPHLTRSTPIDVLSRAISGAMSKKIPLRIDRPWRSSYRPRYITGRETGSKKGYLIVAPEAILSWSVHM